MELSFLLIQKKLENKDQNLYSILGSLADIRTENRKEKNDIHS